MAEPDDITAVDAVPPARQVPAASSHRARWPAHQAPASRSHRARWPVALVLVWAMLAVADLAVFHAGLDARPTGAVKSAAAPGAAAHAHARASAPRPTPTRIRASPPARVLAPVSASAIGPDGLGSGDNPGNADLAIDGSMTTAWISLWYATAHFGSLQSGTGLLIDMGHPVRITSVQIVLGSAPGADLELLTGEVPVLAEQRLQASASDVGGAVRLRLTRPERARYLIVWFTLLPPDSSGTFQVSVHNIRIFGRS
jgi:hypothetical protein